MGVEKCESDDRLGNTVYGWVKSVVLDSHRPKVAGMSEMVVRRRLGIIAELIKEYELNLDMTLVKSEHNLADSLTRVDKRWLAKPCAAAIMTHQGNLCEAVRELHDSHHLGVNRTLYLAKRKLGDAVERSVVEQVVKECHICRRVDPAPVRWETGSLSVPDSWNRLAIDITHYRGLPYLTAVDCGPSKFAVWMKIRNETADAVIAQLERLFSERGPVVEILSDNGPCFRSAKMQVMMNKWGVSQVFSCAYRAAGNGIVERNHRTIKRMAVRSGGRIEDMVFWYNDTPDENGNIPAAAMYGYNIRLPTVSNMNATSRDTSCNPYNVGDSVYIKPVNMKCTAIWNMGM